MTFFVTKHFQFFIFSSLILLLLACKKDEETKPDENIITISDIIYPIVKIGSQMWTSSNYDGPGGIPYKTGVEKPEYGKYYSFDEAEGIVLPKGWRLPRKEDYVKLALSQGIVFTNERATGIEAIKKLVSTNHWRVINGNNSSGFNAYPAGYSLNKEQPMDGDISEFWMADGNTISIQEGAKGVTHNMVFYGTNDINAYRFNLRFVKDN